VVATLIGCAIDASTGNRELTGIFAALYAVGCVAAVLAVRQSSLFTAVVQTPLILFVAVPSTYFLFHRAEIKGVKELLINCGYPLIERFPLMLTITLLVLALGAARWYLGSTRHQGAAKAVAAGGVLAGLLARFRRPSPRPDADAGTQEHAERPPRKHGTNRPRPRPPRPDTRERRPAREASTRSRHARPPMDDREPQPRRRRPAYDDAPPPPRRPRPPRDIPREYRPDPRDAYDYEEPPKRRPRYTDEPDYASEFPPAAPRRQPRRDDTRLPYSNVRYRGGEPGRDDDYRRPR